jgi:hypothetical protein
MLSNEDDVPMLFEFVSDFGDDEDRILPPQSTFECKPRQGVVPRNSFQLITFKFAPTLLPRSKLKHNNFTQTFRCVLNESTTHILPLTFTGIGFVPNIVFENDAKVYFKTTHAGTTSFKQHTIHNPARVDIMFEWQIPSEFSQIFSVDQETGILKGNEKRTLKWSFQPNKKHQYIVKIPCVISSISNSESYHELNGTGTSFREKVYVSLVGEGITAGLTIEPDYVDYGTVLITSSSDKQLAIYNSSDCAIPYRILITETINGEFIHDKVSKKLKCASDGQGMIEGRAHKLIDLVYYPSKRMIDNFIVFCIIPRDSSSVLPEVKQYVDTPEWNAARMQQNQTNVVNRSSSSSSGRKSIIRNKLQKLKKESEKQEPQFLSKEELYEFPRCEVKGVGAYPMIGITDIKCDGFSKSDLWSLFSVNSLNDELASELECGVSTITMILV